MVNPPKNRDLRKASARPFWRKLGEILQCIVQIPVVLPTAVLLGFHVPMLAMLIRWLFRVPYLVSMLVIYTGLTLPLWFLYETPGFLWIFYGNPGILFPLLATVLVLLATAGPIISRGREGILEGENLDTGMPAHFLLCILYLAFHTMDAMMKGNSG